MKDKQRVIRIIGIIRTILEFLLQILVFASISYAVECGLFRQPINYYRIGLVILATIVASLVRRLCKSNIIFVSLHSLPVLLGVVGILLVAYSMWVRYRFHTERMPMVFVGVFFFEYYALSGAINSSGYAFLFVIIFVGLQILSINYNRLEAFLEKNVDTANLPYKQIIIMNIFLIVGTIFIFVVGVTLVYGAQATSLVSALLELLLQMLGIIIKLFIREEKVELEPEPYSSEYWSAEPVSGRKEVYSDAVAPDVNTTALVIMMVLGILTIVFIIAYSVWKKVSMNIKNENDCCEELKTDNKNYKKEIEGNIEISETNRNKRIRKLYKQRVKGVRKEKGTPSTVALPKNITKMFEEDPDKSQKITAIYEKARYSNEEITEADEEDFGK